MAKYYECSKHSPIIFQMQKASLKKNDLCELLRVELNTVNAWLKRPGIIPLEKMVLLAGLFGMSVEELVYILLRNKPQVNKEGKWYLEAIRLKVDKESKDYL